MEATIFILPKEIWSLIISLCDWEFRLRLNLALVSKELKNILIKATKEIRLLYVDCSNIDQIVEIWPYLETINLPQYGKGITTLTCLQTLPNLRSMTLVYKPMASMDDAHDYNLFATLTGLTKLTCSAYTKDADLLKLSTLTNLLSLDLGSHGYGYSLTSNSFDAMKGMTRLTHFVAPNSEWNSESSQKISHLTNLKTFTSSNVKFSGLQYLSNLIKLDRAIINCSTPIEQFEHIPYTSELAAKICFFPQSLTKIRLGNLKYNCIDLFKSLTHLTKLAVFDFGGDPDSVTNEIIETLARLTALQKLSIYSVEYDYRAYRSWKRYRDNPDLVKNQEAVEKLKYKCYLQLNLSSFACLTQLDQLNVAQDPFDEDELWPLTTLSGLKVVSFGWHFNMEDFRKFLSLPLVEKDAEQD